MVWVALGDQGHMGHRSSSGDSSPPGQCRDSGRSCRRSHTQARWAGLAADRCRTSLQACTPSPADSSIFYQSREIDKDSRLPVSLYSER